MFSLNRLHSPLVLFLVLGLAATLSSAGEVIVSWDPSATASGYRLYRSTDPAQFVDFEDVGNSTQTVADGLDDCTSWYFAVTAYNAAGESGFSSVVETWPRAVPASASPGEVERGSQAVVVVTGVNFEPGDSLQLSGPGVQLDSASVDSCSQLTLGLTVEENATLGPVDLTVTHISGVAGSGTGLFSVILAVDESPPNITNMLVSGVDGTSASITWTTNEPADSLVYFRKSGAEEYQATLPAPDLVTDHAVELFGLEPDTTYEYHVSSTDAAGNTATSTPDDTFATTGSPFVYLRFESEFGVLVNPVSETTGVGAFGGAWIDTPAGLPNGTADNPLGTATFDVNVPEAGTWFLWVRIYGNNGNSNSWFDSIDGSPREILTTNTFDAWVWTAGQSYQLAAGLRTVELGGRKAETRADRLLLTNDPDFVPSEEPGADIDPPQSVTGFEVAGSANQLELTWANPSDPDFVKTVIRFRSDGQFPMSPVDGSPLVDETAAPGSLGQFTHTGLEPGTIYSYSAFAIDQAGNVAEATTLQGTPPGSPPTQPQGLAVF